VNCLFLLEIDFLARPLLTVGGQLSQRELSFARRKTSSSFFDAHMPIYL
jgi:hypothetical protein